MVQHQFITIWEAPREAQTSIYTHQHPYYELVYYLSGSGTTCIGGTTHRFSPGRFALIAPDCAHSDEIQTDTVVCCLGFTSDAPLCSDFFSDEQGAVRKLLRSILSEISQQPAHYEQMITLKLSELLICLKRLDLASAKIHAEINFDHIIHYLSEDYHEKIRFRQLSEQMHISYDYFQHRFKKLTGVSPQQFLIIKRLEGAAALLRGSTLSCTEIALRCGFSGSSQFSCVFKRHYGVTPSRYRDQAD